MVVTVNYNNTCSLTAMDALYVGKLFQHIYDLLEYYFMGEEYYNLVSCVPHVHFYFSVIFSYSS